MEAEKLSPQDEVQVSMHPQQLADVATRVASKRQRIAHKNESLHMNMATLKLLFSRDQLWEHHSDRTVWINID